LPLDAVGLELELELEPQPVIAIAAAAITAVGKNLDQLAMRFLSDCFESIPCLLLGTNR
jgi:hypothetical protein